MAAIPDDQVVVERVEHPKLDVFRQGGVLALMEPRIRRDERLIEFAELDRVPGGRIRADDLENDCRDVRLLAPICLPSLKDDLLVVVVSEKRVGTAADGSGVEVLAEFPLAIDVLGNDEEPGELHELARKPSAECHLDEAIADRAGLIEIKERKGARDLGRLRARSNRLLECKDHVAGEHRRVVGKPGLVVQHELIPQPVGRDCPRRCEAGRRVQVLIEINQGRVQVRVHVTVTHRARSNRVQRLHIFRQTSNECAAVASPWRRGRHRTRPLCQHSAGLRKRAHQRQHRKNAFMKHGAKL